MSVADLGSAFELIGAFTGFWMFLLSADFRSEVIEGWKNRTLLGKLAVPVEIFVAVACGVLPFALVGWLVWATL